MSTERSRRARRGPVVDGVRLCSCGCGKPVTPPRRNWHSQACVDGWINVNQPAQARNAVEKRDGGICAACGIDANAAFRRWCESRKAARQVADWICRCESARTVPYFDRQTRAEEITRSLMPANPGWTLGRVSGWDMDHIVEVVRGGGLCGLDNLQTLCHPCHKAKTARLARERADERKAAKPTIQTEIAFEFAAAGSARPEVLRTNNQEDKTWT